MKKINILITGVSSSNSITFIKGLRRQKEIKFNIFGTDTYDKNLSLGKLFCDHNFQIPSAYEKQFIPALLKICKKNHIKVLVPIIDEEFKSISKSREKFSKIGTLVMLSNENTLKTCLNKIKFCEFLKQNDFPVPQWYLSKPSTSSLPIIKKPILGRGSQNIAIISNQRELAATRLDKDCFFQKYISGTEYTVDTLSDMSGKVLSVIPRIRQEIINGKSLRAKTTKNKQVEETAAQICSKLGITGPACLQCIVDNNGIPYFFEANPRIGSATIISIQAGVNIPFLATKLLLGLKIGKLPSFKPNLIMIRYFEEFYTLS